MVVKVDGENEGSHRATVHIYKYTPSQSWAVVNNRRIYLGRLKHYINVGVHWVSVGVGGSGTRTITMVVAKIAGIGSEEGTKFCYRCTNSTILP